MKKVLFFSYMERHLKKMIPVIHWLERNSDLQIITVVMTEAEYALGYDEKINIHLLDEYAMHSRIKDFDLQWGLEPLIETFKVFNPDLFVCIEVNYILRLAIHYCKKNGINNVVIQHGIPNELSIHAFAPFEGDKFLAWGQFTKDLLVKNHVPEEKICLTGAPSFDYVKKIVPNRKCLAEEIGCDKEKKWLVFTTQGVGAGGRPSEYELRVGIIKTIEAVQYRNDVEIIFQVHPGQSTNEVACIVESIHHKNCYVGKYSSTEHLIAACDGMITFFSTTAIDSLLLEKPLLLINFEDTKDFLPFADLGVAYAAHEPEEIDVLIEKMLNINNNDSSKLHELALCFNYKNDGRAIDRVGDEILKMIWGS